MAQFYAEIQGSRGMASRMGGVESGIWGHIRGWNVGVRIVGIVNDEGEDEFFVYRTSGSGGGASDELIARIVHDEVRYPTLMI